MTAPFSQRFGLMPPPKPLSREAMPQSLLNRLWSVLDMRIWKRDDFAWRSNGTAGIVPFSQQLWFEFFKSPTDTIPSRGPEAIAQMRAYFFEPTTPWHGIYGYLEAVIAAETSFYREQLIADLNLVLATELAAFRVVGKHFVSVTDPVELAEINSALQATDYPTVAAHIDASLRLMSIKDKPDFRNSIKESVSAVESMAKVMTGKPSASFDDALKIIEKDRGLHPALRQGFSKLFAYTSDSDGIRHAYGLMEKTDLTIDDAKFFLVMCTTFINYLKTLAATDNTKQN